MSEAPPRPREPFSPAPRFRWPDGARCAVMLSFDIDGETTLLSEGAELSARLTSMSQCEYGPRVGVPRLLDLLAHLELSATFFVPGWIAERHPGMLGAIARAGHEIGAHGYLHERLSSLSAEAERDVLRRTIGVLGDLTGRAPRAYRAPWFELTPRSVALLAEHGFVYDSSLMGDDVPYRHPEGPVEIPVQWMLEDWEQFAFNADPPWGVMPEDCDKVFRLWWDEFSAMHAFGCCCVLVMHPWLMGRPSRVRLLERLIGAMRAQGGVWFAQGETIARYVLENPDARREIDLK